MVKLNGRMLRQKPLLILTPYLLPGAQAGFYLLLLMLLLSNPSATQPGPFGWWADAGIKQRYGWQIGPLVGLPLLVLAAWLCGFLAMPQEQRPTWQWGKSCITLPLFGLTILACGHVAAGAPPTLLVMLLLFWFIYLFQINQALPQLKWVFLIVLVSQSGVAILQFFWQRPLGLAWLGEVNFDVHITGSSVVLHNGTNWLRAYGLNSHPNQLGLLLAFLLLYLWPHRHDEDAHPFVWVSLVMGVVALLVSWSRAAWLAWLVGMAVYSLPLRYGRKLRRPHLSRPKAVYSFALLAIGLLFLNSYGDILANRLFLLDGELEYSSIYERWRDVQIAINIIGEQGLQGVGLGSYMTAARHIAPDAQIVHNVPLLVFAELGIMGALLWFWFLLAPLWPFSRAIDHRRQTAVWLAMIVIALFQPEPQLFLPKGAVLWAAAAAAWQRPKQIQFEANNA